MIKKFFNLVMCLGLLLQNFLFVLPVMADELEGPKIKINGLEQGGEELDIVDGYYIMSANKNPNYVLDDDTQQKNKKWILYLGFGLGGTILLGVGIYLFVNWRKSK